MSLIDLIKKKLTQGIVSATPIGAASNVYNTVKNLVSGQSVQQSFQNAPQQTVNGISGIVRSAPNNVIQANRNAINNHLPVFRLPIELGKDVYNKGSEIIRNYPELSKGYTPPNPFETASNVALNLPKQAIGLAQDGLKQSVALASSIKGLPAYGMDFTPSTPLQKAFLGSDVIKPFQSGNVSNYAQSKGVSKQDAQIIGGLGLTAGILSNFMPAGEGSIEDIAKQIASTSNIKKVASLSGRIGIKDEQVIQALAKETDVNKVLDTIKPIYNDIKKAAPLTNESPLVAKGVTPNLAELKSARNNLNRQFDLATSQGKIDSLQKQAAQLDSAIAKVESTQKPSSEPAFGFRIKARGNEYIPVKKTGEDTYIAINTATGEQEAVNMLNRKKVTRVGDLENLGTPIRDGSQNGKTVDQVVADYNQAKGSTPLVNPENTGKTMLPPQTGKALLGEQTGVLPATTGNTQIPDLPGTQLSSANVSLPGSLPQKERSFTIGARTSPDLSPTTQQLQKETSALYDQRKNSELKKTVSDQIDKMGLDTAKQQAMDATDLTDEGTARAIEVAKRLDAAGQHAEANQVLSVNAQRATEAGRAAQANALLARQTSLGIRSQLLKLAQKNGKTVSESTLTKVGDMMDEALKLPEGRDRNLAMQKVDEFVQQQFPSTLLDQALTVIQAGLLTGIKTSGFNEVANAGNAIIKKVSDAPSTLVDMGLSLFTGKRSKTFTGKGAIQGISDGSKEALDYLISGYDPSRAGSKYEGGTTFANNKVGEFFKNYTNTIYRFMGAQDRPFKKVAFFNSVADQAGAEAKNLGLGGKEANKYIEDMLQNPTNEIGQRAAQEADVAVFANDTLVGKLGQSAQKLPGGKAIIPFAKTPSAVVATTFSYTPVGTVYEIGKQIKAGKFDQRALAEAIGKGATGTALLWIGTELAKQGMITTSFPKDPKEVALWTAQNKKENSINLPDGTQIPAQAFGPASQLLIIGAAMQEAKDRGENPAAVLPAQIGSVALNSPALQGAQNLTNALQDPTRYGESWTQSLAGMTVPTLSGDIAQGIDRAPNGEGVARQTNGPLSAITNKIPGLRQTNPVSLTTLGQERTTGKNLFQTMIDPTRSSTMTKNPVLDELSRLSSTDNASMPTKQSANVQIAGEKIKLNQQQLDDLQKQTGQGIYNAFSKIILNPEYQKLSDENKASVLSKAVEDIKATSKVTADIGASDASRAKAYQDLTTNQETLLTNPAGYQIKLPTVKSSKDMTAAEIGALISKVDGINTQTPFTGNINLATSTGSIASKSSKGITNLGGLKLPTAKKAKKAKKAKFVKFKTKKIKATKAKTITLTKPKLVSLKLRK